MEEDFEFLTDEAIHLIADGAKNSLPCVYIVGASGNYKIGHTKNLEARVSELQTGNAERLIIITVIQSHDPVFLEGCLHRKYEKKRIRGEWFSLDEEDVAYLKNLDTHQLRKIYLDDDIPF